MWRVVVIMVVALIALDVTNDVVVEPGRVIDTVISVPVAASSDDAIETSGAVTLNGTVLAHNATWVGLRFTDTSIPAGATINSARIDYVAGATNTGTAGFTIYGEQVDSGTFTTDANNLSSRTRTLESVSWSPANWTTLGQTYSTTDIAGILQEQVYEAGWNGNVVLLINTVTGNRRPASFDNTTYSEPTLIVDYTEPTPTPTNTPVPPTDTPIPPTPTDTPIPPTPTDTPIPPTPTDTPIPPTPTDTPIPPTPTDTPIPPTPEITVDLPSGGQATVTMSATVGEIGVVAVLLWILFVTGYSTLRKMIYGLD